MDGAFAEVTGANQTEHGSMKKKVIVHSIPFSIGPRMLVNDWAAINADENFPVRPLSQQRLKQLMDDNKFGTWMKNREKTEYKDVGRRPQLQNGNLVDLHAQWLEALLGGSSDTKGTYSGHRRQSDPNDNKNTKDTGTTNTPSSKDMVHNDKALLGNQKKRDLREEVHNDTNDDTSGPVDHVSPERSARIVGGSHSPPYEWPWLASIQYLGEDLFWYHFCGGSLVHTQWVVTAAHCLFRLENCTIRVVLGDYQLSHPSFHEQFINPARMLTHGFYDPDDPKYFHDIGMIKLAQQASVTSYVHTIDVATPKSDNFNGQDKCYISGWGSTSQQPVSDDDVYSDVLRQGRMNVLTQDDCRYTYGTSIVDSQICIVSSTTSACMGDSGGPLICMVSHDWKLAGLASFIGSPTCALSYPNVYTRTSSYYVWINGVINQF